MDPYKDIPNSDNDANVFVPPFNFSHFGLSCNLTTSTPVQTQADDNQHRMFLSSLTHNHGYLHFHSPASQHKHPHLLIDSTAQRNYMKCPCDIWSKDPTQLPCHSIVKDDHLSCYIFLASHLA